MKNFTSYLNASLAEDKNPFHIIVIGATAETDDAQGGKWLHSGVKDYWQFTEQPASGEVRLHMARQKHVNTKSGRIAWHVNGFKHDKLAFNNNLNGVESARNIAKAILKLPEGKVLETLPNENAATLLAGLEYLPNKSKIFVFSIADK